MPLGGFLIAVFAGWVIDKKMMQAELGMPFFRIWPARPLGDPDRRGRHPRARGLGETQRRRPWPGGGCGALDELRRRFAPLQLEGRAVRST